MFVNPTDYWDVICYGWNLVSIRRYDSIANHSLPFMFWYIFKHKDKSAFWIPSQYKKGLYRYRDSHVNTLRPRQNGCLFADDTFKHIFLNENITISIEISLKFVPKGFINNIPALVLIMAWHQPGDKSLSEPMMVRSLTHICVTRPQWVN